MRLIHIEPLNKTRPTATVRFDHQVKAMNVTLIPLSDREATKGDVYTWGSCEPLLVDVDGNQEIATIELLQLPRQPLKDDLKKIIAEPATLQWDDSAEEPTNYHLEGDETLFRLRFDGRVSAHYYKTNSNIIFGITTDHLIAEWIYLG